MTTTSCGPEAVPASTTNHVELQVSANESPSDHSKGLSASTATSDGASCLPATMLTQQLPPLPKYSGEDPENEPFQDWILQFEMIADLCKWNTRAKLVHLTTRLRGQAFAFY